MIDEIFNFALDRTNTSIIKVIGVGGGGCNAVKNMFEEGIEGVNFMVCNTDAQAMQNNPAARVPNLQSSSARRRHER